MVVLCQTMVLLCQTMVAVTQGMVSATPLTFNLNHRGFYIHIKAVFLGFDLHAWGFII